MTARIVFVVLLATLTGAVSADSITVTSPNLLDPTLNVAGTAQSPGGSIFNHSRSGNWTIFHGYDAHVTYVSETGPEEQRNEIFSTNWFAAGAKINFGNAFLLGRARLSAEPYTLPDNGYPQILQYVSAENGGELLVDSMRAHDFIGEAAIQGGWQTDSMLLGVYAGLVGDPALGPPPSFLRSSGVDLAEAPFSYDIAETHYDSTNVVTGTFAMRTFSLEASVFHDAVSTGDHTEIPDGGDLDSQSFRVTFMPTPALSMQISKGQLGEDLAQRDLTSASLSYGGPMVAVTALWTRREFSEIDAEAETAYGFELALRGTRHTAMGRAEWVDRPLGFPVQPFSVGTERTTHFAVGYIYDFLAGNRHRAGAGINIDYHTQSHDLEDIYGHKPQSIYAFVRFRSGV